MSWKEFQRQSCEEDDKSNISASGFIPFRKARMGSPKAITAMAHKLARVLWHLLKYRQPFNAEVFAKQEAKMKRRKLARLEAMATTLNYRLVPNQ